MKFLNESDFVVTIFVSPILTEFDLTFHDLRESKQLQVIGKKKH